MQQAGGASQTEGFTAVVPDCRDEGKGKPKRKLSYLKLGCGCVTAVCPQNFFASTQPAHCWPQVKPAFPSSRLIWALTEAYNTLWRAWARAPPPYHGNAWLYIWLWWETAALGLHSGLATAMRLEGKLECAVGNAALERKHPAIPFMVKHEYLIISVSINVITQLAIQSNRTMTRFSVIHFIFSRSALKCMIQAENHGNDSKMAQTLVCGNICNKIAIHFLFKVQNSPPEL